MSQDNSNSNPDTTTSDNVPDIYNCCMICFLPIVLMVELVKDIGTTVFQCPDDDQDE